MEVLIKNITDSRIDNPYQFYLDYTISHLLNTEEQACFHQINTHYENCFSLIKANDPVQAAKNLENGTILLKKAGTVVKTMVNVFSLPFISYYHYKIRSFATAVERSEFIISAITALEQTDHEYLFFARIQQQQNIGRIYWAENDIKRAVKAYSQCLLDIHAKAHHWHTTQIINDIPVISLAEQTQYMVIIQLITEISNRIITKYHQEKSLTLSWLRILLKPLLPLSFEKLNTEDMRYQSFDSYISIFNHLTTGNDTLFLEQALIFLENEDYDKEMRKVIGRYLYYFGYV